MPIAESFGRAVRAILAPIRQAPIRLGWPAPAALPVSVRPYPWEEAYPEGLDWDLPLPARPLTELLDRAVADHGERICIRFRGRTFRYKEVGELVARAARGFRALGVHKDIKVALMLPNCPYTIICYYAVLKAGGTVVNVNPLYAGREIAHLVADSGACIMVTLNLKPLYRKVAPLLGADNRLERIVVCGMAGVLPFSQKALFPLLKRREIAAVPKDERHVTYEWLIENGQDFGAVEIDPRNQDAVLQYTGGTTGAPKGARLTHANLTANALQVAHWQSQTGETQERLLAVLPLFHAFGMTGLMNMALAIGAELILLPHFKVAEVLRTIDREKPTTFLGVPTMFSAIAAARDLADHDLSSLRCCISGGAPLPLAVKEDFERLTGCPLLEGYGLSEAGPVCSVNPLGGPDKPGSVGLPLPGTVVEITRLDRPFELVPAGERGEICLTGPQVMLGYANRAQENVDAFRGGRLHTGDVGYLDEDGYLYIVDRIKDLILTGGFNVYPRMVEEAIYLHPSVAEAAVCGLPDPHLGEVVKAFVKLHAGHAVSAAELRAFLKDKLAPFELPRKIEFRAELPKTLMGKVSKRDLLAQEGQRPNPGTAAAPAASE